MESEKLTGWQPIETAPKDGGKFDVWVPSATGGYRVADLWFNANRHLTRDGVLPKDLARWPTHWIYPPAPPGTTRAPADLRSALEVDMIGMLTLDHKRMRAAGTALAEAALRVVRECDGLHRLSLAVADWAKAIADEGGRAAIAPTKGDVS